jgi:hypothetical protein
MLPIGIYSATHPYTTPDSGAYCQVGYVGQVPDLGDPPVSRR